MQLEPRRVHPSSQIAQRTPVVPQMHGLYLEFLELMELMDELVEIFLLMLPLYSVYNRESVKILFGTQLDLHRANFQNRI